MINPSANPGDALARFNAMPLSGAVEALARCCGSRRWAEAVAGMRPFESPGALHRAAENAWFALEPRDWLEAFAHHPRIGERDLAQATFAGTAEQSAREQSGMAGAGDGVRAEFAALNVEYERKFGHVFLICATGKSAGAMLEQARRRLGNDGATELQNAAKEQSMI